MQDQKNINEKCPLTRDFFKFAIPGLFFGIFVFSKVNSNYVFCIQFLGMTGFEPQISSIWVTTTAPNHDLHMLNAFIGSCLRKLSFAALLTKLLFGIIEGVK